jgi:multidrug transporter EmrE-like cation transporter
MEIPQLTGAVTKSMEIKNINSSRWKSAMFFAISIAFVLLDGFILQNPLGSIYAALWTWFGLLFFSVGVLLFGFRIFCPSVLILDEAGIILDFGFPSRWKKIPWGDVRGVLCLSISRGQQNDWLQLH